MKKLFSLVILLVAFVSVANAQTIWSAQVQSTFSDGDHTEQLSVYVAHSFESAPYGVWGFTVMSPGWAEWLIGVSRNTTVGSTYVEAGVGIGLEQPELEHPRFAATLFATNTKMTGFLFLEYGKETGHWYLLQAWRNLSSHVAVGVHAQRFVGAGPRVNFSNGHATFWVAPVFDHEADSFVITTGIQLSF